MEEGLYTMSYYMDSYLKKRKINLILIFILMSGALYGYPYIMGKVVDYAFYFKIVSIINVFIALEYFLIGFFLFRKLKKSSMKFDENSIVRKSGKNSEFYRYDEVEKVNIKYKEGNIPEIITIKVARKKVMLCGFSDMEKIADILKEKIDSSKIIEKNMKIDWNNPLLVVIVFVVTFAVLLVIQNANFTAYDVINKVIMFSLGIYFIIYRPLDRSIGGKLIIGDYILGALLIIMSLVSLFYL